MINHPNRSAATRIRWVRDGKWLTAIWPDNSAHQGEEWTFSRPGGGYVYCNFGDSQKEGSLGRQICDGGFTLGCAISASDESFEKVVKKWVADYRKKNAQD